jgi:hypothetical protein
MMVVANYWSPGSVLIVGLVTPLICLESPIESSSSSIIAKLEPSKLDFSVEIFYLEQLRHDISSQKCGALQISAFCMKFGPIVS